MPGAIEMLKQDHQKVKQLFKEFEKADSPDKRKKIAAQAIADLETHSKLEEQIFYPAVWEKVGAETMREAEEEHHGAKMFMQELIGMDPADQQYEAKFTVLREQVEHHIQEEESDMLPKAEKLGKERLSELAGQMQQRRAEFEREAKEMVAGRQR